MVASPDRFQSQSAGDPWSPLYLGAKIEFASGVGFLWSTDNLVKVNDFIIFENFEIF